MRILILALLAAGLLAGCATTTNGPSRGSDMVAADGEQSASPRVHRVTGSRIPQRVTADGRVYPHSSSPVVVYGREELERSGEPDISEALRLLHPLFY